MHCLFLLRLFHLIGCGWVLSSRLPAQLLRYAELRSALELSPVQMSEYFKVKSVQGQSSQGKVSRKPCVFFWGDKAEEKKTWKTNTMKVCL